MRARTPVLIAALIVAGAACGAPAPVLVRVDMPGVALFPAGTFDEILVSDFRNEAPLPDLDVGLDLKTYLAAELDRAFSGTVSLHSLPAGAEIMPSYWKEAAAGRGRVIFLTGSVRLESAVLKALKGKGVLFDSPFDLGGRSLVEKMRWTLFVDLLIISGESGEALFKKSYRETRDYIDLEKPADFAFSELSAAFRDRLFPSLLGVSTIEERTLLRR
jgi:hypothetical protein